MSTSRPPVRWVAHMDLDAFFASCEQREQPQYKGHPVVVGARPGHRGVVAAASYEARRFGIHSAMPISEAYRRCPDAIYLRPDIEKYRLASQQVFKVLESVTPIVEAASIDEAYLDVSGLDKLLGTPEIIGGEIKRLILAETGLTASVGIGPNRLIAKLGSEHRKPDGLMVIPPDQVLDFLAPMPVSNLRGLGQQTQKIFHRLGIHTVAQLRAIPLPQLEKHLGTNAAVNFHRQALGIASAEIMPGRSRKSISKETTFEVDIQDHVILRDTLRRSAADVAKKARREGLSGLIVTLKTRFAGFETRTRQRKLPTWSNDERVILRTAWDLFLNGDLPKKPVRLIGVGLSNWQDSQSAQSDLFEPPGQREDGQRLLETMDAISEKFGDGILQIGVPPRLSR